MSTIRKVIERIDTNKPNAFTTENKVAWLAELDGKITANVFLMDVSEMRQFTYDPETDMDTELLVRFPHDDIYYYWLSAKIDAENGEYDKYQNTMQLYNACYNNFVTWFLDTYDPVQGCSGHFARRHNKPSYYITAYGLAVKRGFVGTIDEWLASLVGKSAYAHAVDGGYTGTLDDFVRKMAEDFRTYYVTMTTVDGVTTADKTFEQLREKHLDGFHIRCRYPYSGTFVELDAVLVGDSNILFSGMRENVAYSIQMHADGSVAFAADLLARSAAIGQVSGLATADKTSLVAAINEVADVAKKASKSGLVCLLEFPNSVAVDTSIMFRKDYLNRAPEVGEVFVAICGKHYTAFQVTEVLEGTFTAKALTSVELNNANNGQPIVVAEAAAMTDPEKPYLYVGSEEGYQYGAWYYWNGDAWVVGGEYAVGKQGEQGIQGVPGEAGASLTVSVEAVSGGHKLTFTDINGSHSFVFKDSADVSVEVLATSITLDTTALTVYQNKTHQLNATVGPEDATDKTVAWYSSNETVATVDENGLVTGVTEGSCTILAATSSGAYAEAVITVEPPYWSIEWDYTMGTPDVAGFAVNDASLATMQDDGLLLSEGYRATLPTWAGGVMIVECEVAFSKASWSSDYAFNIMVGDGSLGSRINVNGTNARVWGGKNNALDITSWTGGLIRLEVDTSNGVSWYLDGTLINTYGTDNLYGASYNSTGQKADSISFWNGGYDGVLPVIKSFRIRMAYSEEASA